MPCGYGARLEDVMAEEREANISISPKKRKGKAGVQDGNVREEDANDQSANCGGYHGAIHAPRRRLLENTRTARAC